MMRVWTMSALRGVAWRINPCDVCEILYVEDNPELRETIGMLMEGEGRTVTSCASAEEALVLDAGHP